MTRRSIRKYSTRDIDDALLNSLLAEAEHTQTMGNLQLYSVVVTRSSEMKQKLAPAHFNQPMVTQAPVVFTFCADYNRTTQWGLLRKGHPGYDNFLSYQNAATDALLYCQRFAIWLRLQVLVCAFLVQPFISRNLLSMYSNCRVW